jgi:PEP-CTERM motif-containing protein
MRANLLSRLVAAASGLVLFGVFASISANAAYVVTFEEVGPNVEAVGGGSINLAALKFFDTPTDGALVFAQGATELTGAAAATPIDVYAGISGPLSFGPGSLFGATGGSGGVVGVLGDDSELAVPTGYESGSLLSEESVYANQSLASMGLIPAVYVYKWGSGDTADSLTIVVGDVPEPSSWALLLLGFAGLGYIGNRASWKGLAIAA